jgi:hypothetical protein
VGRPQVYSKLTRCRAAASKTRKKDLPTPDHANIDYEPFRKAFYTAPTEVLDMDEEDVENLRLELDGIKVRGLDAPRPVRNWGAFGLPTAWCAHPMFVANPLIGLASI